MWLFLVRLFLFCCLSVLFSPVSPLLCLCTQKSYQLVSRVRGGNINILHTPSSRSCDLVHIHMHIRVYSAYKVTPSTQAQTGVRMTRRAWSVKKKNQREWQEERSSGLSRKMNLVFTKKCEQPVQCMCTPTSNKDLAFSNICRSLNVLGGVHLGSANLSQSWTSSLYLSTCNAFVSF